MKSKATGIQLIDHSDQGKLWDLKINVVRDDAGKILSGIVIGPTMEQNMATIMVAYPGEFKFEPTKGVGLKDALLMEGSNLLEYRHRIIENFRWDGLNVKNLDLFNLKNFSIDAEYE